MKCKDDEYYGRMGVVVRKGGIVNNGRTIYKVRLLDRKAKDPASLYMVDDSLSFAEDQLKRKV